MYRFGRIVLIVALISLPAAAQTTSKQTVAQAELNALVQAQQALTAAEQAGARTYATTLYEEAAWRVRTAQENWEHNKKVPREEARFRAIEGLWAARAALAKANWLGTNVAIRNLQGDITRLGGRMDVTLEDEEPSLALNRGATSREKIEFAQRVVDAARKAGADGVAAADLKLAQQYLDAARKVVRAGSNSEIADYQAYVAEMMARRAFYLSRTTAAARHLTPLQIERTRLAQAESERAAAAERAQREEAERRSAELQRQLQAEQASRQAQSEEVARLRAQVEESRQLLAQRLEADRAARLEAERRLDEAFARYESAVAGGNPTEVESLRRQVEDLQISLRAVQERERMNEQTLASEIERLRGQASAEMQQELARRQAELDQLRREREADIARRTEAEQKHQAAVADAQRRREEAEAQAEALRRQITEAQQAAQQATQQAQQTQAELERTRQELASRDAELRSTKMQQELSRIAATRRDERGLIVTLPGIFFDTGKSVLKPGAKRTLDRIAAQLKSESSLRVSVEGHSDSVGSEESNQVLSERRAEAVRAHLIGAGVPEASISSSGKGEASPIATNKTAAGRQQNRRVELIITQ
ncbi:MAG TPA: OmpA family protein [Thermoanaerobaculia bacterium]|nr:OmpA family protein [Thermoanaerobaculia bacterium]